MTNWWWEFHRGNVFVSEGRRDASASGNNSPGASMCSDSELPYISYTVDRPIGGKFYYYKT